MKRLVGSARRSVASGIALALSLAFFLMMDTSPVNAQTAAAALRGKAPPSTEVVVRNVATGLTRRTTSTAEGIYSLVGLPPGTYTVKAGSSAETTAVLSVASTTTLDLDEGAVAVAPEEGPVQSVTVTGTRLAEVRTSEVATTIAPIQIETLPQITRNFLEFADTVPGLAFSVDPGGNTSLRGGAQGTSSVNVYVDGVGQKNYVKEGGVSGQFFSQGNPFPQLAIGEYKVITSNYKAEYDQISSAAVTAETRSGTNQFEAQAVGSYTADNFRARTPSEVNANVKTPSEDKEFGVSLGGPIIQDVMHFFVTYEGKRFTTPIAVTSGGGPANVADFLPPDIAAQLGPAELPFDEDLFFGKVDWEPTESDRLVLAVKVRRETQALNIGVAQAASHSIETENNDTRVDLRWQHTADRWFNELLLTYEDTFNSPTPVNFGNGAVYTYQPSQDAAILNTGPSTPFSAQHKGQKGPGIQNDFTLKSLSWHGDHTVKTGIKLKKVKLSAQDAEDINPQFFYDVNPTGTATIPYKVLFTTPVPGLNPVAESNNTQIGLYIQDDWAPNEKLTLNLGVRWDYERTPSYLNQVTPANVVAALNSQDPNGPAGQTYAQSLALGGVDVNDYISTGNNRSPQKDAWQPRLGLSYDLNADQAHVIFAGIGRSYDRDLYDYLQLEQTKASLPIATLFFNVAERPCTPSPTCIAFDPSYLNGLPNLQGLVVGSNTGQEVDMINNRLKVPYSNQFSLGMRNRLGNWNTSAAIARVVSKDGFAFTLGNRRPDGTFFQNGNQPFGNPIPGFGALIVGSNGAETRATQVLLSVEKPFSEESRWGTTLAYTYTRAKQNRDVGSVYAFDEPTIGDYPFVLSNAAPRHRFVATGTFRAPWGVTLAGKLTLATPTPESDVACYLAAGQFFPTGSSCTPDADTPPDTLGYKSVDLQATKSVDLGERSSMYVRFDVLNAFNSSNYSDYRFSWGQNGTRNSNPVTYNPIGNITGVPRTFKASLGMKF
jgi:outer membrane receptor protein involved in Fe transport